MRPKTIPEVVESQLCAGCGVCAYLAPERYAMVDDLDLGRRPIVRGDTPAESAPAAVAEADAAAFAACPGAGLEHRFDATDPRYAAELTAAWGPVLAVFEGHADDDELRFEGSSGGVASALAAYAVESAGFHGVLHTRAREDVPYLNETVLSRSREEIVAAAGSRYAPASPCDGLDRIEGAPGPCLFIGKPCDAAATVAAARARPALAERLGAVVAFFCAGAPSTRGTLELLRAQGIDDPARLRELRYRGRGWPGMWSARAAGASGEEQTRELTYADSWGELQRYRQWRCYVCADHTGEFADIAVGDPWYRPQAPGDPGRSLILVRTERGRRFLEGAVAAGHVTLEPAATSTLPDSQRNLLETRGAIWARMLVCRLLGAAAPRYRGFPMVRFWLTQLSPRGWVSSLLGTARRIFRKGLRRRVTVRPFEPEVVAPTSVEPALPAAVEGAAADE